MQNGPSASKMAIMATIKVTFTTEPLIILINVPAVISNHATVYGIK